MARKENPLDRLVMPRRGPVRQRKSGAGLHDSRPNRQRTRRDAMRAELKQQAR